MTRDSELIEDIKNIFSEHNLSGCYAVETGCEFDIVEIDDRSCIKNGIAPSFKISNPNLKSVRFIAIDHCFITDATGYTGKRNDCVIFDDIDFCFIELKLNVTSHKTRRERTKEAMEQLEAGIDYFKANFHKSSKNFMSLGFNYEAYIVFPTPVYPKIMASGTNRQAKFAKLGVKLIEDNKKTFS